MGWLENELAKELEVKAKTMGPLKSQEKELVILNRTVRWSQAGIEWEADPRHAQVVINELWLENGHRGSGSMW